MNIGILGTAAFADRTLLRPAAACPEVTVRAVASRDVDRAQEYATARSIPVVHPDYDALLADDELDAVYLPLPNTEHEQWVRAALRAGRHVLCERPLAGDPEVVTALGELAAERELVLTENLPHRYHPLLLRTAQALTEPALGTVRRVRLALCLPVRWRPPALEHLGHTVIDLARMLFGELRPVSARVRRDGRCVRARLALDPHATRVAVTGAVTVGVHVAIGASHLPRAVLHVATTEGELRVLNPFAPHLPHQLAVRVGGDRAVEHFPRRPGYAHQLDAFAAGARAAWQAQANRDTPGKRTPVPVPVEEIAATTRVLQQLRSSTSITAEYPAPSDV